ncbi:MAG: phospholipid carrier-dependent glycosyltransferase [Lachnospiraceae bacterium]|nr:phospholipid carrier-dependent glycosyltransferase [Lachnospiraceae bacterium]
MVQRMHRQIIRILEKGYGVFFGAACLVLALFCFYHLDVKYVDSWDEARHGVNAYEMLENGNFIQHTYNYEVDTWNLKPPLSYWGILLGFGMFGCSVFGLRFYSALCYLLTGIVTGLWVGKRSRVGGILVLGFFCANTLPLYAHLARAGDADSLYLMLFTFAMLSMLELSKNKKYLYVCGLCFSLAFLTKSWHAGMLVAIGGLFLLVTGEIRRIKWKEWGLFLLSIFLPLALWFGWRYGADGLMFFRQMIEVDLLARTGTANFEGHSGPVSFYWEMVFGNTAYIYPWVLGVCVLGGLALLVYLIAQRNRSAGAKNVVQERDKDETNGISERTAGEGIPDNTSSSLLWQYGWGLGLWFGVVFFGFSLMKTKLIWYCYPAIVPVFVLAALILGKCIGWDGGEPGEESGEIQENHTKTVKNWKNQILPGMQLLLIVGCVVVVLHFMKGAYETAIRDVHGDGFQDFLKLSASQDSAYAGWDAYIQVPGEKPEQLGDWDQNRLFLAEISGNFRCKDGGVVAFLQAGPGCVIYLDRENYAAFAEELWDCEVLYLNEGYPYVVLGR